MNESDYLRRQLAAERAHLGEVLDRLRRNSADAAAGRYLAWATPRLLAVYERHLVLLPERLAAKAMAPQAAAPISLGSDTDSARLAQLLAAWDSAIETPAADCYRIEDWRRVAQLRADDILQERQLHAAMQA